MRGTRPDPRDGDRRACRVRVRSARGERWAGLGVVAAIFISAMVPLYETVLRLIDAQHLTLLWVLAAAGVVGFIGNEIAARVRLRGGKRLNSPALIANGNHARLRLPGRGG